MASPDLAALGSSPIPGDSPTGVQARAEPEFEKLQAEVQKLQGVDPGSISWSTVLDLSQQILSTKSKDLAAAAYLADALLETKGFAGFATGLKIIQDLLATFWDSLWPEKKRMRGRMGALTWLTDRIEKSWPNTRSPAEADRAPLEAAVKSVQAISAFTADKFEGEGAPNLALVVRSLQEKIASIPAPSAEPAAGGTAAAQPTATGTAKAADVGTPEAAKHALPGVWETLYKAATTIRKGAPGDPISYVLMRIAVWGDVLELPAKSPGGDPAMAELFEQRLAKKDYPGVLEDAEARLASDPLWLDLNLWVARAMEGMGFQYDAAKKVVADSVATFVRRVPGILDLKFESGQACASPSARTWVLNEVMGTTAGGGAEDPRAKKLKEARALAARRQLTEAIAVLQKEAGAAVGRRDRFRWKLDLARVCLEGGKATLALPLLESLDADAQKFMLDEWEPDLSADVVKLMWECYRSAGDQEKAKKIYARLSSLDVTAALALDGNR